MAYSALRIDAKALNLPKEIKARMASECVMSSSFDFILKKIIEKEDRKITTLYLN